MANKTKNTVSKNFLKSINELKKISNTLKKKSFKLNFFKKTKTKRKLPKRPKKSKTRKHRGGA